MKHTKTAAALLAAVMALSACGNGGKTENTNAGGSTTAANAQANDTKANDAQTTTSAAAETTTTAAETTEAATTTEAEPTALEYPIIVELEDSVPTVSEFNNGKFAVVCGSNKVTLFDVTGKATGSVTLNGEGTYFDYEENGIFHVGATLFDTEGNIINDRYAGEGEGLNYINSEYVIIIVPDNDTGTSLRGIKDRDGNWILEPKADNVLNSWIRENGNMYVSYLAGDVVVLYGWGGSIKHALYDIKAQKIITELDASKYQYFAAYCSPEGDIYILSDNSNNEYVKIDRDTGEQTTLSYEGKWINYKNDLVAVEKDDTYEIYDTSMNKKYDIAKKGSFVTGSLESGYYVLKDNDVFTYYTFDGEAKYIVKGK